MGTLQNDTRACIACTSASCDAARTLKSEAYIHMIHNCYWYYNNHAFSNTNTLTVQVIHAYLTAATGVAPQGVMGALPTADVATFVNAVSANTGATKATLLGALNVPGRLSDAVWTHINSVIPTGAVAEAPVAMTTPLTEEELVPEVVAEPVVAAPAAPTAAVPVAPVPVAEEPVA